MAEYIDRNKLVDNLRDEEEMGVSDMWEAINNALDRTPTADAVEVVRCKDCKYFKVYEGTPYCDWCGRSPNFDDFCSRGDKDPYGVLEVNNG